MKKKNREKKEENKRDTSKKLIQILIKGSTKEVREVPLSRINRRKYKSGSINVRSAGISFPYPGHHGKKIRTHMTSNISIYFSKQQLITELTKNSVLQ